MGRGLAGFSAGVSADSTAGSAALLSFGPITAFFHTVGGRLQMSVYSHVALEGKARAIEKLAAVVGG